MTEKVWHSPIWIEKRALEYSDAVNKYIQIGNKYDAEMKKRNPSLSRCKKLKTDGDKEYEKISKIYKKLRESDVRLTIFERKKW